jgi:hypothetical protein
MPDFGSSRLIPARLPRGRRFIGPDSAPPKKSFLRNPPAGLGLADSSRMNLYICHRVALALLFITGMKL